MSQPSNAPPHELPDLVAVMAHDLKNPLAALVTNLHFLRGALAGADADTRDALDESVTVCDVLERLTKNVDLLVRSDDLTGKRNLVALRAIVDDVVARAQHLAKTVGVELIVDGIAADSTAFVDQDLFRRAFENVVANALEVVPFGTAVRVGVATVGAEAVVAVTDAREQMPEFRTTEPRATSSGRVDSDRLHALYGRGLTLLCADLAARAAGARLEVSGGPRACRLCLFAPARESA